MPPTPRLDADAGAAVGPGQGAGPRTSGAARARASTSIRRRRSAGADAAAGRARRRRAATNRRWRCATASAASRGWCDACARPAAASPRRPALAAGAGRTGSRSTASQRPRRPRAARRGPGEVEIAVEATGLNFKDVLNALGMYPGDPGPLGGECAGHVVAPSAPASTHVRPGDAVLAVAGGSFASHVVATRRAGAAAAGRR